MTESDRFHEASRSAAEEKPLYILISTWYSFEARREMLRRVFDFECEVCGARYAEHCAYTLNCPKGKKPDYSGYHNTVFKNGSDKYIEFRKELLADIFRIRFNTGSKAAYVTGLRGARGRGVR
jgi:hypothetical protein